MTEPDRRIKLSIGMWIHTKRKLAHEARMAWPIEHFVTMTEAEQDAVDQKCQDLAQSFMKKTYVLDLGLPAAKAGV